MKMIKQCMIAFVCMMLVVTCSAWSQKMSDNEYRTRWSSTEEAFNQQHENAMQLEEKKKDVETYMQMGKEYLDKKQYATALMCFRSVVEIESDLANKQDLDFAQEQIGLIEAQMQQEIKQDMNNVFGKNWPRREEGLKRILDRMPSTYTQKWAQEQEEKRLAAIEAEKQKVRDEIKRRRLELEQQVLQRSLEVNEELYVKRLEMLKKQVEIDEIFRFAKELFSQHNYKEVIENSDKILSLDPNNSAAKSLKADARYRLEEEKILMAKKEADTKRAIAHMKKDQEEETRKQRAEDVSRHLTKGKDLYSRKEYIEAIAEFKAALGIDGQNLDAKLYLEQIKVLLDNAKSALEAGTEVSEESRNDSLDSVKSSVELNGAKPTLTLTQEEVGIPVQAKLNDNSTQLKQIPKTNLCIPAMNIKSLPQNQAQNVTQPLVSLEPQVQTPTPSQANTKEAPVSGIELPLAVTQTQASGKLSATSDKIQTETQALPVPSSQKVSAQPVKIEEKNAQPIKDEAVSVAQPLNSTTPVTPGQLFKPSSDK